MTRMPSTSIRILIDCRRRANSGVGRVAQWLGTTLGSSLAERYDVVYLVTADSLKDYVLRGGSIQKTEIRPYSEDEYDVLPRMIAESGSSVYINAHLTWSPLHTTRTINIVHDVWTIERPDWLPGEESLARRFDIRSAGFGHHVTKWFEHVDQEAYLTPLGMICFSNARRRGHPIEIASWAQYAAVLGHSSSVVAVFPPVKRRLAKYFRPATRIDVINNVPIDLGVRSLRTREHILVLAKLEPRKNIGGLLDAYTDYAARVGPRALGLIIAGDRGYPEYATRILNRLADMVGRGASVRFLDSVSDAEMSVLLGQAAVLVNASLSESFGFPAVEAMLAEIPVISTRTGLMRTELGRYAVLVEPGDTDALRDALLDGTRKRPSLSRLAAAREAVRAFIQRSGSLERWMNLIARVATA